MRGRRTVKVGTARTLMRCFGRTYFVGTRFNTRGMQNIGLAYAIEPGLRQIHANEEELVQARSRYIAHYNTHPFWTPFLAGFFLFLEREAAKGVIQVKSLEQVKTTTVYTLSAVGDSFFSGAVLVFWSLSTSALLLLGKPLSAFALAVCWIGALQLFKGYLFLEGYRNGLSFLQRLKRWDLINWGQRIKVLNGLLIIALWVALLPGVSPAAWFAIGGVLCALAWMVDKLIWLREILALALFCLTIWILM